MPVIMARNRPRDTGVVGSGASIVDLFAASSATLAFDDGSVRPAAQLADEAPRIAGHLAAQGVGRGDRVAVRMRNGPDHVRLLLACAARGAVVVSVNTRYGDAEATELAVRTGAVMTVEDRGLGDLLAEPPVEADGGSEDPFVVFTTSGTTNRPKMVLHRQRSIVEHAHDVAAGFGYSVDDVVMVVMPLCGTFGLASLMGAVAAGSRVVVTEYQLAATARLVEAERVTCVNGSDDLFHRLLERGTDLSSVRLGGYARFNTSLDGIVARAADAGATLTGLYGMSEVQALFALRDPTGDPDERSRAGGTLVSPRAECRVVHGELQVRGPSLFAGYLAEGGDAIDEQLTADHHTEGWFRTGDLAEADGPRGFEYLARMGDVLRLGGFLVGPAEIESVLLSIEGVDAAQVVAVDRPGGARPVAFVIAPGGVDEQAAIERCRERLAGYKVPVRVVVLDEFPTTPSANGTKIRKVELRRIAGDLLPD
jgi:fatty-acyl-CoA synthase